MNLTITTIAGGQWVFNQEVRLLVQRKVHERFWLWDEIYKSFVKSGKFFGNNDQMASRPLGMFQITKKIQTFYQVKLISFHNKMNTVGIQRLPKAKSNARFIYEGAIYRYKYVRCVWWIIFNFCKSFSDGTSQPRQRQYSSHVSNCTGNIFMEFV